jgi:hypothetical protein
MSKLKKVCFLDERVGFGYFSAVIPNSLNSDINSNCLKCFFILKKEHKGCSLNRDMVDFVFLNFEPLRLYILKYIFENATIRHYPQLQRPIFSRTMCFKCSKRIRNH